MTAPQASPLTLFQLFDAKAQAYLTAYDATFNKSASIIGNVGAYAEPFMFQPPELTSDSVQLTRIPVPLTAPELILFEGRQHFQENGTGYIELQKAPYTGGVKEFLERINAVDWTGFSSAPEVFAELINSWPSQQCVSQLATAENTLSWDGITNFLATTKYSNPYNTKMMLPGTTTLATYKNFWAATQLTVPNAQALRNDLINRRGFDNRPLGYSGTHLVHSPNLTDAAEAVCLDLRLPGGATNPFEKYKIKPEVWYDLPPKRWGLVHRDPNRPIFVASKGSPMSKVYGIESAMFEVERKVGWNVFVQLAKGLGRSESLSIADTG